MSELSQATPARAHTHAHLHTHTHTHTCARAHAPASAVSARPTCSEDRGGPLERLLPLSHGVHTRAVGPSRRARRQHERAARLCAREHTHTHVHARACERARAQDARGTCTACVRVRCVRTCAGASKWWRARVSMRSRAYSHARATTRAHTHTHTHTHAHRHAHTPPRLPGRLLRWPAPSARRRAPRRAAPPGHRVCQRRARQRVTRSLKRCVCTRARARARACVCTCV